MIIRRNKSFEISSNYPNSDWYNERNCVVDENTEEGQLLAQKIINNYPHYELITEIRQVPILKEQPVFITEIDETTGEEIEVDTGDTEWVETGEYNEVEFVVDVIVLEDEKLAEQERLEQERLEQELLESLPPSEKEILMAEIELNTINLLLELEVI